MICELTSGLSEDIDFFREVSMGRTTKPSIDNKNEM